jgi:hypothetical protein
VKYEMRPAPGGTIGSTEFIDVCVEYDNTTPGGILANTVHDAMGAPIQRIVNADSLTAIISALINAALTALINLGDTGINPGLANVSLDVPECVDPNPPPDSSGVVATSCDSGFSGCGSGPRSDACWCGEWGDAIWAYRHVGAALSCNPSFTFLGHSAGAWQDWVRGQVANFIGTMERYYSGGNQGCVPNNPNYGAIQAAYSQIGEFCGLSTGIRTAVCGSGGGGICDQLNTVDNPPTSTETAQ